MYFTKVAIKSLMVVIFMVGMLANGMSAAAIPSTTKFTEMQYRSAFINWMNQKGRLYASEDFGTRYENFKANYDFIEEWNSKNSQTVLGLTQFADMTNDEYRANYLGTVFDASDLMPETEGLLHQTYIGDLPASVDWRQQGAVTPVKNQAQCGSCWSFSTTGSLEGAHQIRTGNLVSLSEQQLIECSWAYGNQGCNGGLMDSAFSYIIHNGGIMSEESYPYTSGAGDDNGNCKFDSSQVVATMSTFANVTRGDENNLAQVVVSGPVSIAIDAGHQSFQLYKSGIYYESQCSSYALDHGVLLVGYGTDASQGRHGDYWIVKNSWADSWGQQGYILMARNRQNHCGVATMASQPLV
ncbi:hypothetical protein CYY_000573 [Polysphondylium violaceum]|uniref:Uncharacterized protein n=1 Tax=Polysphondylium violaceum TaxID=133409 RepID=A0A8J4Q4F8_9MYCE|nr:hypothetical protein CYY_000573 [Polysphondylium violaceum]